MYSTYAGRIELILIIQGVPGRSRRLIERNGEVSLSPSIGNWSFPCQSHYWIENNRLRWAAAMSPESIKAVQRWDRRDADLQAHQQMPTLASRVANVWRTALEQIRAWWRR